MDDMVQNTLWLTLDNTYRSLLKGPSDQFIKAYCGPRKCVCVPLGGSNSVFLEMILYEGRAGTLITLIRNN